MKYNKIILNRNIRKLMKENDITQNDLARISNTQQARVSKCLNDNNKGDFTISQLIAIAEHFHVPLDDLLGLENTSKNNPRPETFSDIFEMFFLLEDYLECSVEVVDIEEFSPEYGPSTIARPVLYFNEDVVIAFLKEWKIALEQIKSLTGGEEIYKTWKQGIISKYRKIKCFDALPFEVDEPLIEDEALPFI